MSNSSNNSSENRSRKQCLNKMSPKHSLLKKHEAKAKVKKRAKKSGKHRLRQSSIKVNIDGGQLGFTYVGPLSMGTANTVVDVVYDTGSDWLAVEGSECKSCEGNTYDGTKGIKTGTELAERNYGSA